MRTWFLAVALTALVLGGFLLFETTTSSDGVNGTMLSGCGVGALRWPDAARGEPDASWERAVADGEVVRLTHPSGRYALVVETADTRLEPVPLWERPAFVELDRFGCRTAPIEQEHLALGGGRLQVRVWMYD